MMNLPCMSNLQLYTQVPLPSFMMAWPRTVFILWNLPSRSSASLSSKALNFDFEI